MSDADLLPDLAPPPGGLRALRARIAPTPRLGRGWLLAGSALAVAAVVLLWVRPRPPAFSPAEMLAALDPSEAPIVILRASTEPVIETDEVVMIRWRD